MSSVVEVANRLMIEEMNNSLNKTIAKICKESDGLKEISGNHHLNGTFKQLCDKKKMVEILFPGTSSNVLQNLPKDLKQVLQWTELELDIPKIARNAAEVLTNIKIRGAGQGDVMDKPTEIVLLPQIAQEALAKGILECVRSMSRRVSKIAAEVVLPVASITADQATFDQLDESTVVELLSPLSFGTVSGFMGNEWVELIRSDSIRFASNEKMSLINNMGDVILTSEEMGGSKISAYSKMCWIEPTVELAELYPALNEVITQMHALPYEINNKWDGNTKLKLFEPNKGCTMLLHYIEGSSQILRLDSKSDGSSGDSGVRLTCSYHFNELGNTENSKEIASSPNKLIFQDCSSNNVSGEVEIVDDLLVIHQSTMVKNERTVVTAGCEYFALIFFIQGKEDP
eukprot:gene8694-11747_t